MIASPGRDFHWVIGRSVKSTDGHRQPSSGLAPAEPQQQDLSAASERRLDPGCESVRLLSGRRHPTLPPSHNLHRSAQIAGG